MLEEKILFERFLRTKNLKMTRPREIVLEAFVRTEGHLSAEDIFDAARRIDPGIGQATVFRTLKLLAEAGLARDACQDEGPRRYEHSYHHAHHDHLLCTSCGKIVEFFDLGIEKAQEDVFRRFGFEPRGHSMELRGLCPECGSALPAEGSSAAAGSEGVSQ